MQKSGKQNCRYVQTGRKGANLLFKSTLENGQGNSKKSLARCREKEEKSVRENEGNVICGISILNFLFFCGVARMLPVFRIYSVKYLLSSSFRLKEFVDCSRYSIFSCRHVCRCNSSAINFFDSSSSRFG